MTTNRSIRDDTIEAIHATRRRMAERFHYDPEAIAEEARRRQQQEERPVWRRQPIKDES